MFAVPLNKRFEQSLGYYSISSLSADQTKILAQVDHLKANYRYLFTLRVSWWKEDFYTIGARHITLIVQIFYTVKIKTKVIISPANFNHLSI